MSKAITGELSIKASDGAVLTDVTDLGLAWQWAEHEHGPEAWSALTVQQRNAEVAEALAALREAHAGT